jgi:hypothetical protein
MSDLNTETAPQSLAALRASLTHRNELPGDNRIGAASLAAGCIGFALIMVPFATPVLGLAGVCLGAVALAASRRNGNKPRRAAAFGLAISILAVGVGSVSTAEIMQGWNHYRSCNQRFDPAADPDENHACLHGG